MKAEQIYKEIEKIDNEIKALEENRCEGLICKTNENDKSLKIEQLLEKRMELYYQLNTNSNTSTKSSNNVEENIRHQEKVAIAKNLLDLLDDEVISGKTGLTIDEVKQLRK